MRVLVFRTRSQTWRVKQTYLGVLIADLWLCFLHHHIFQALVSLSLLSESHGRLTIGGNFSNAIESLNYKSPGFECQIIRSDSRQYFSPSHLQALPEVVLITGKWTFTSLAKQSTTTSCAQLPYWHSRNLLTPPKHS